MIDAFSSLPSGPSIVNDPNGTGYRGMCPDLTLYDFRVLDGEGRGEEFAIIAALQFIRYINARADQPLARRLLKVKEKPWYSRVRESFAQYLPPVRE